MSVDNEKEIQQLKNRIRELADKSYNQNQYTFTGFLGLAEQDALWQGEREKSFALSRQNIADGAAFNTQIHQCPQIIPVGQLVCKFRG